MNSPKSVFLKNIIKRRNFNSSKDRNYVENLLLLENIIINGVHQFGQAMAFRSMKSDYPKEYAAMKKELDPKGYAKEVEQEEKNEKETKVNDDRMELEAKKRFHDFKKMWNKVKSEKE